MSTPGSDGHPDFQVLLDYWFGDVGKAKLAAIDEHLMLCDRCGAQVDVIAALATGVRCAFLLGEVGAVVSADFVEALKARALCVREYRAAPGASIACTVAPGDDVLISRLQATLQGVRRLDVFAEGSPCGREHLQDVPFDASGGELVLASPIARVRLLPAHELQLRLVAVEDDGSRELGRYTFRHTPWH
jgi:hypothetical protein